MKILLSLGLLVSPLILFSSTPSHSQSLRDTMLNQQRVENNETNICNSMTSNYNWVRKSGFRKIFGTKYNYETSMVRVDGDSVISRGLSRLDYKQGKDKYGWYDSCDIERMGQNNEKSKCINGLFYQKVREWVLVGDTLHLYEQKTRTNCYSMEVTYKSPIENIVYVRRSSQSSIF